MIVVGGEEDIQGEGEEVVIYPREEKGSQPLQIEGPPPPYPIDQVTPYQYQVYENVWPSVP